MAVTGGGDAVIHKNEKCAKWACRHGQDGPSPRSDGVFEETSFFIWEFSLEEAGWVLLLFSHAVKVLRRHVSPHATDHRRHARSRRTRFRWRPLATPAGSSRPR